MSAPGHGKSLRPTVFITDAMVDTVGAALYRYWNDVSVSCRDKYREKVRAALNNALNVRMSAAIQAALGPTAPQPAPVVQMSRDMAKQWLSELMSDHDFTLPADAYEEIVAALAANQSEGEEG